MAKVCCAFVSFFVVVVVVVVVFFVCVSVFVVSLIAINPRNVKIRKDKAGFLFFSPVSSVTPFEWNAEVQLLITRDN